jgi:hypothetical protein
MTNEQEEALKKDFLEFSGGFTPDEAYDEVELYKLHSCPDYLTDEELDDFFDQWVAEMSPD